MAKKEDNRDVFDKIVDDLGPAGGLVVGGVVGRFGGRAIKKAFSKKTRDSVRYGKELLAESKSYSKGKSPTVRQNLKRNDIQNKEQFIDAPLRGASLAGAGVGAGAGAAYGDYVRKTRK
jgi:hypothetical protein